ncbi:histidinol dehydrogenase [Deinococcus planocerae]|uniref:histidinol dehydrogenase n=1 Tax=Deinococcus planocerae TaxID=1737569 RepID=UPI000C7F3A0B|nr:histidinol dehydrogenase [Deinococcus planocerae]
MEYLKRAEPQSQAATQAIRDTVSRVLLDVERERLAAVRRYSEQFDGWNPESFHLSSTQIEEGLASVPEEVARSIDFAVEEVRKFARLQRESLHDFEVQTLPGVTLGQRHIPVNAVGAYVPGGRYPLIASAIMTIAVPRVAGVGRVVATTPPQRGTGKVNPAQLYAMARSGVDAIYALGGVQAMAAMAYGLDDAPPLEPVDMIVGAGNAYVAEAKRQLFGTVGIDLLAGPTEICILADDSADPRLVAADLLGQAEHGTNSPAVLVTTSREVGEATLREIDRWLPTWPTAEVAGEAWRTLGEVIVVEGDEEMVRVSDQIASEHLEVQTRDPRWFLTRLTNYGSLFLGQSATVVYGDKGIGTNHVLPTGRAARYTGGLWVGKFIKTVTWQHVTPEGDALVAPHIAAVADAEGMAGHALTARLRLEALERAQP